jgi:hypothetical protein
MLRILKGDASNRSVWRYGASWRAEMFWELPLGMLQARSGGIITSVSRSLFHGPKGANQQTRAKAGYAAICREEWGRKNHGIAPRLRINRRTDAAADHQPCKGPYECPYEPMLDAGSNMSVARARITLNL